MEVCFFASAHEFRDWLQANHATAREVWVGLYKKRSGKTGLTYTEAVEEALCFGWIDGVMRRIDDTCHAQRFSPRKPGSNWSAINIARAEQLIATGRMAPPGLTAFTARDKARSTRYSYENRPTTLEPGLERRFKAHRDAWRFFDGQPPSYKRTAIWWVMSAVKAETRERRLAALIDASARGRRPKPFEGERKR